MSFNSPYYSAPSAPFGNEPIDAVAPIECGDVIEAPAAGAAGEPLFLCVVPGRPVITEFEEIDSGKMVCMIEDAAGIKQICVSLLRPDIPEGFGVGVFFTTDGESWNYLGCLTLESPSAFYRAAWNVEQAEQVERVQLGLSLEPLETLREMVTADQIEERKTVDSATSIAKYMHRYITSFSRSDGRQNHIVIPNDAIDKWLEKFAERHARTPFFWLDAE